MTMTTRIELPYPYEWRYLPQGTVRHAVNAVGGVVCVAACGVATWSSIDWYGTGCMHEYEMVAALPDCQRCVRIMEKPR